MVSQRREPVRKPHRYIQERLVFRTQFHAEPFPERSGRHSKIDCNVENSSDRAAHQFGYWRGHVLVVHSSKNAITGAGVGILHEVIGNSRFCEALPVPGLDEKTTLILEVIDVDEDKALQAGMCDVSLHFRCAS